MRQVNVLCSSIPGYTCIENNAAICANTNLKACPQIQLWLWTIMSILLISKSQRKFEKIRKICSRFLWSCWSYNNMQYLKSFVSVCFSFFVLVCLRFVCVFQNISPFLPGSSVCAAVVVGGLVTINVGSSWAATLLLYADVSISTDATSKPIVIFEQCSYFSCC